MTTNKIVISLSHLLISVFLIKTSYSKPQSIGGRSNNIPNRYVQSSPPCLAAQCRNGVALVALHMNVQQQQQQYQQQKRDHDHDDKLENENEEKGDTQETIFLPDLPSNFRGPLRIELLDDRGSVLMTCGWRTDGLTLADTGRELIREEVMKFGSSIDAGISKSCDSYGRWLGWGLVKYLVKCESRDNIRSLSTMGLLATTSASNNQIYGRGQLYLIDPTGIVQCRAYAIGSHALQLNERLSKETFHDLNVEEGVKLLLDIVKECSLGNEESGGNFEPWDIPAGTCIEIVIVDNADRKMRRLRQQSIFSKLS